MEPPSYEEACLQPPVQGIGTYNLPYYPPYSTPLTSPPTPPPAYGDAVTIQPDPFPILTPPSAPPVVTSPHHSNGVTVHPLTRIDVTSPVRSTQTQPRVIVNQPAHVTINVSNLRESPGLVHCSNCQCDVTTKTSCIPGKNAWLMCFIIACSGAFCGFCLIPLCVPSLQDVQHSCPRCGKSLHLYRR